MELERLPVVVRRARVVGPGVPRQGGGHQVMVSRALGLMNQGSGQMPAGAGKVLARELDFREVNLCLFRHLRCEVAEAGEPAQNPESILITAKLPEMASHAQQTIGQVERHAHGAASMQVMGINTLRRAHYKSSKLTAKMYLCPSSISKQ